MKTYSIENVHLKDDVFNLKKSKDYRKLTPMKLYNYYRSSASFRVRIALALKGISYEYIPVHLIKNGGEQLRKEYRELNPMGEVPCLVDGSMALTQSMAILLYLDEQSAHPRIFPEDRLLRARVLEFCETINSGMQPFQNLNVLARLKDEFGASSEAVTDWVRHYSLRGYKALETRLEKTAGTFCFGDTLTAADVFLVPQVFSSKRFEVPLEECPKIRGIYDRLMALEPFKNAEPSRQPDAESV
jgi:maleylacetoacetate isomerase